MYVLFYYQGFSSFMFPDMNKLIYNIHMYMVIVCHLFVLASKCQMMACSSWRPNARVLSSEFFVSRNSCQNKWNLRDTDMDEYQFFQKLFLSTFDWNCLRQFCMAFFSHPFFRTFSEFQVLIQYLYCLFRNCHFLTEAYKGLLRLFVW